MTDLRITGVQVIDLRFPTSRESIGSDAVNKDPDYSAAYCILETNHGLRGFGLTFTCGHGNELCCDAIRYLARYVKDRTLSSITDDLAAFSRQLTGDTQFRWLGPEKGVIHLATAALINAVWDLYSRAENKPLWQLLAEMEPERIASVIDFHYINDALTRDEAIALLKERRAGQEDRLEHLRANGLLAYTTSVGWIGFSDEKISRLCDEALAAGWTHFKLKVGGDPADDRRRARMVREKIGPSHRLMMDANQKWDVEEAILRTRELQQFDPWWMEEPTSPDDVLGHARIRREVPGVRIATGEHCQNRILFKQFMQAHAIRSTAAASQASTKTSPSSSSPQNSESPSAPTQAVSASASTSSTSPPSTTSASQPHSKTASSNSSTTSTNTSSIPCASAAATTSSPNSPATASRFTPKLSATTVIPTAASGEAE